jgi:hypothetical protein
VTVCTVPALVVVVQAKLRIAVSGVDAEASSMSGTPTVGGAVARRTATGAGDAGVAVVAASAAAPEKAATAAAAVSASQIRAHRRPAPLSIVCITGRRRYWTVSVPCIPAAR